MGQTSSGGGGINMNLENPGAVPGTDNPNIPSITNPGVSIRNRDMNNTDSSHPADMVRDVDLSGGLRTTTTAVTSSQEGNVWTWNFIHIAVVSSGVALLVLVVLALLIFVVYYKRVLKPKRANVSFVGVSPSYHRARSTIFNRFAAEEAARRITAKEDAARKRTPSPRTVSEEIPMAILSQMQNDPTIEYDDEIGNTTHQQETEVDGVFHHHSMPHLDVEDTQIYNELPHHDMSPHTMPHPRHHQVQTHSHQRYHPHPRRRIRSDVNGNVTHPMHLSHLHGSHHPRKYLTDHRISHMNNKTRGRLLSEPVAPQRLCACYLPHRPMPRTMSGVGRTHRSFRPNRSKLPKFNLAGENIPTSSEPSVIFSGTRAPRNSLSPEDHHHHHHDEPYDENYNNTQDLYPNSHGPETCTVNSFVYVRGRNHGNTPTPRLVVPTNTPNSHHSGAGSVSLCGGVPNTCPPLDSDFGASAGVSQCNVSSDTSMTVAIGTGCSVSVVGDLSYEWDGYDPAYHNSQILGYLDGAYFPILHTSQYWV
ncbi:uncharacterized protein [Amphiura filiformis]|uniref:uncharacterized protein n=1 Tax=Amphiura filiformis TaxID=82378 RepID=UPI003B21D218